MQDYKHLVHKQRGAERGWLPWRRKSAAPSNTLRESKQSRLRLRILLPLLALLLALYPAYSLLVAKGAKLAMPSRLLKAERPTIGQAFQLAAGHLSASVVAGGERTAALSEGGTVRYTVDEALQQRVTEVLATNQVPYGVFVAIEPKTGRILALTSYSAEDPAWANGSYYRINPMASLFKIITAAAALEAKKVSPETVVAFRGRYSSENPKYWQVKPGSGNREMGLAAAMGKSVNPVFGRLASDVVGRDSIMAMAERFGFNQALFAGAPVLSSTIPVPQSDLELKLMGAGLGREVKISPLHAAAVIAAIANGGVMLAPGLAEEIRDGRGNTLYAHQPEVLRRVVTPETAAQLARMLSTTVSSGTSRRIFHDRRGRPRLAALDICAKTGSIDGKDPAGHYSWFAGYAPADDPQIALVALVINRNRWRIKATYVGEQALEAYFK